MALRCRGPRTQPSDQGSPPRREYIEVFEKHGLKGYPRQPKQGEAVAVHTLQSFSRKRKHDEEITEHTLRGSSKDHTQGKVKQRKSDSISKEFTTECQKHFPFLELPAELRNKVYGYVMNFHQRVQIPYHYASPAPATKQLQLNTGFKVLRVNKQIYKEAILLFCKECTVYLPISLWANITLTWAVVSAHRDSTLGPAVRTTLTALAHCRDVHLSFYWPVGDELHRDCKDSRDVVDYADFSHIANRLHEIANMLDTVHLEGKDRRRVTVHVVAPAYEFGFLLPTVNVFQDSWAEGKFDMLLRSGELIGRQNKNHTEWTIAAWVMYTQVVASRPGIARPPSLESDPAGSAFQVTQEIEKKVVSSGEYRNVEVKATAMARLDGTQVLSSHGMLSEEGPAFLRRA
ncbi:hypothetical protein BU23DRAFT_191600 [Bimuria novae-zelandiae CBS 107.79]|uniref:Uncharacterized protein n=1 Tax=Bimuria novae-zelandiae CBS 107.79 TaxID=1447943 RepID=A0A6A5VTB3_9PLEO|nr:hypothetical protein BU23DRAFT_191600 [Bimuria novae-zelandiae CBS 107.79]